MSETVSSKVFTLEDLQAQCSASGEGGLDALAEMFGGSLALAFGAYLNGLMDAPLSNWLLVNHSEQIAAVAQERARLELQCITMELRSIKNEAQAIRMIAGAFVAAQPTEPA